MPEMGSTVLAESTVVACAAVSCPLAEIESVRSQPGPGAQNRPPLAKVLRNADEQTVVAIAAILKALQSANLDGAEQSRWGVIGGPRFLGRMIISAAVARYYSDPKYSLNPHLIPNYSLHSLSGTASIGLGLGGMNVGVGGGPRNVPETLLTGLSASSEKRWPGLWVLLGEFDPEPIPDDLGNPTNSVTAFGVALGLTNGRSGLGTLRLVRGVAQASCPTVCDLVQHLTSGSTAIWKCPVEGLGVLELTLNGPAEGARD